MSRIPRSQEHLKTAFTAEAVSAARYRAYAMRADREGFPNLAQHWLRQAAAKDALAISQLEAADQVRDEAQNLAAAIAEERYETDVLYPKMARGVNAEAAGVFEDAVAAKRGHLERLSDLQQRLQASQGDVESP